MGDGDLYENVEMKRFSSRDAAAPGSTAAPRHRPLGPALALAALVALAMSLAALGALYVRAERELRAARAAAAGASAPPACAHNGSLGPKRLPRARRSAEPREPRGQWLQRFSIVWKHHAGKVYYFSRIKKTWNKSESFCTTVNAHLVTVSSAAEQEFLAREAGNESYWIGLTDAFTEGTWRWVDGTEYRQDASFWAPGQPDNWSAGTEAGEDCGHLQPEDSNLWNDKPCSASLRWICARSLDADGL